MQSSTTALIILGVMLILFISERLPTALTAILACMAFAMTGVIPLSAAFSGFGNEIVYLIAGMVVVGSTFFETGVAQLFGKKIIAMVGTNERVFIVALIAVSTVISMFLSNTATVALMLPIAASAVAASDGVLKKKNLFMMVGISSVASGGLTLIGSTPQLIAKDYLLDNGFEGIGFFEISKIGVPVLLLSVIYFLTIGLKLQKKVFDFDEVGDDMKLQPDDKTVAEELEEAPKNVKKMLISVGILVFCIAAFVTEKYVPFWNMGIIAMLGAALCVATGCISEKKVFARMDWTTILIMGSSFGIGKGLADSGAGAMIAQGVVKLLGDNVSPWILCAALALVAILLTNFMSSTATATLLIPIAALVAAELGFDVKSVVVATAIAINMGFSTPICTPPMTMTLAGGYRFKDYIKVGGLFNLLAYLLIVLLFPIMFKF